MGCILSAHDTGKQERKEDINNHHEDSPKIKSENEGGPNSNSVHPLKMKYKELKLATQNFKDKNALGEGSFGKVYRGVLRDGMKVAVKKLNPESFQGLEEWLAEIIFLDKFRHPNLVRLVGHCSEMNEALLVYELCEGGSLESALFSPMDASSVLSWKTRVRIVQETAEGLAHLHENKIIHRDLKPSNILLTRDLSVRITDFGLAKHKNEGHTHVSTRVMGTMGYLDPDYLSTGKLRDQTDVYSFGIILLELITGKRAMDEDGQSLSQWIRPILNQKKPDFHFLVDPELKGKYSEKGVAKIMVVAKHCINPNLDHRPSMLTILQNLRMIDE